MSHTSNNGSPNLSNQNSQEGSNKKLKMELSHISFLKPHIINEGVYNLAHQGHTREKDLKSDVVKSLEQHRRYKKIIEDKDGRNRRN